MTKDRWFPVPAEHIYLWWRRALHIQKGSESTHSASWEHILLPLQVCSSSVTRRLIPLLAETLHSWTCSVAWTASNRERPQLADGARQNGVGTAEHSLILDVCQQAAEMFTLPLVSASINTQPAINNKKTVHLLRQHFGCVSGTIWKALSTQMSCFQSFY